MTVLTDRLPTNQAYREARSLLANAASLLMKIPRTCGPNTSDMQAAIDIMKIAMGLGIDEGLGVQLDRVDNTLDWSGSGLGRIEAIKALITRSELPDGVKS